ncbi:MULTISPECIES: ABC transporter ATP-binding protein [Microbacterium]|uniref:ATP-binding cassette domain-containing protein n=1 Tax=Microbacterium wangchenii TaxID=2541726 RepID=A0ABX5SW50_9MICO|nr:MULTISPECIES: ATP-binding cassette domain-containing protein [Microbacterium]MCK6066145.1 ATP-binding cassette domain-containing protein [Microbacterium sp. EYE_512]QBR90423.1 ATP-binding cassette domain-containing protein [Microbacterium wangchenii]TXK14448.1 ATP-binding cassette domain-containing protein [Microbacterium wangchenii]
MSVLQLNRVSASYGPAGALFGIDIEVDAGEMVGVLGRNGAGKTSTFKAIMGMEVRRRGQILFDGADITRMVPEQIARAGIAIVPAERRIFSGLSVLDNLRIAARMRKQKLDVDEIVDLLPIMGRLIDREGFQLSGGEQQAVAIARALAARPRVLLLDEPTEGLAPVVVQELQESIAALPQRTGAAVLVAEQNLNFVLQTTSRVYVLETGNVVHASDSAAFARAPELQHKFLSVSSSH